MGKEEREGSLHPDEGRLGCVCVQTTPPVYPSLPALLWGWADQLVLDKALNLLESRLPFLSQTSKNLTSLGALVAFVAIRRIVTSGWVRPTHPFLLANTKGIPPTVATPLQVKWRKEEIDRSSPFPTWEKRATAAAIGRGSRFHLPPPVLIKPFTATLWETWFLAIGELPLRLDRGFHLSVLSKSEWVGSLGRVSPLLPHPGLFVPENSLPSSSEADNPTVAPLCLPTHLSLPITSPFESDGESDSEKTASRRLRVEEFSREWQIWFPPGSYRLVGKGWSDHFRPPMQTMLARREEADTHPWSLTLVGITKRDQPCLQTNIGSEKKEQVDAAGEEQVDAAGEEQVDADGEEQVDAAGEEQVDAAGEEQVDADGEEQVDADGEEQVDAAGEEQVDADGEEQVDADGEEGVKKTGFTRQYRVYNSRRRRLQQVVSLKKNEKIADQWRATRTPSHYRRGVYTRGYCFAHRVRRWYFSMFHWQEARVKREQSVSFRLSPFPARHMSGYAYPEMTNSGVGSTVVHFNSQSGPPLGDPFAPWLQSYLQPAGLSSAPACLTSPANPPSENPIDPLWRAGESGWRELPFDFNLVLSAESGKPAMGDVSIPPVPWKSPKHRLYKLVTGHKRLELSEEEGNQYTLFAPELNPKTKDLLLYEDRAVRRWASLSVGRENPLAGMVKTTKHRAKRWAKQASSSSRRLLKNSSFNRRREPRFVVAAIQKRKAIKELNQKKRELEAGRGRRTRRRKKRRKRRRGGRQKRRSKFPSSRMKREWKIPTLLEEVRQERQAKTNPLLYKAWRRRDERLLREKRKKLLRKRKSKRKKEEFEFGRKGKVRTREKSLRKFMPFTPHTRPTGQPLATHLSRLDYQGGGPAPLAGWYSQDWHWRERKSPHPSRPACSREIPIFWLTAPARPLTKSSYTNPDGGNFHHLPSRGWDDPIRAAHLFDKAFYSEEMCEETGTERQTAPGWFSRRIALRFEGPSINPIQRVSHQVLSNLFLTFRRRGSYISSGAKRGSYIAYGQKKGGYISYGQIRDNSILVRQKRGGRLYRKQKGVTNRFSTVWEPLSRFSWLSISQALFWWASFKYIAFLYITYGREALISLLNRLRGVKAVSTQSEPAYKLFSSLPFQFKDFVFPDRLLAQLVEIVWYLRGGGRSTLLARIPKGMLLVGPPGTGKTLLVRSIAGEAKVPVVIKTENTLHNPQTEKPAAFYTSRPVSHRIGEVFKKAEKVAPCILFFDEIDSFCVPRSSILNEVRGFVDLVLSWDFHLLERHFGRFELLSAKSILPWEFGSRGLGEGLELDELIASLSLVGDLHYLRKITRRGKLRALWIERVMEEAARDAFVGSNLVLLSQFLALLDGFQPRKGVVVVGATNRPEALDPALLRPGRFGRVLYVPLPGRGRRIDILKLYTKRVGTEGYVPWVYLANRSAGWSAAAIAAAANQSTIRSVLDHTLHTLESIERGVDSIAFSGEGCGVGMRNPLFVSRHAYYQAGKAVACSLLPSHPSAVVFWLWTRSHKTRQVAFSPLLQTSKMMGWGKTTPYTTRKEAESRLIGLYAGKAGEVVGLMSNPSIPVCNQTRVEQTFLPRSQSYANRRSAPSGKKAVVFKQTPNGKRERLLLPSGGGATFPHVSNLGENDFRVAIKLAVTMVERWHLISGVLLTQSSHSLPGRLSNFEYSEVDTVVLCEKIGQELKPGLSQKACHHLRSRFAYKQYDHLRMPGWWSKGPIVYAKWKRLRVGVWWKIYAFYAWAGRNFYKANKFYQTNNRLSGVWSSAAVCNQLYGLNRDYIYHNLMVGSFGKALLLLGNNRELLDYFAHYLVHHKILREDHLEEVVPAFYSRRSGYFQANTSSFNGGGDGVDLGQKGKTDS